MRMYSLEHVSDLRGKIGKYDGEYISWLGLQDLYFFSAIILGYGRLGLTGFHFEMCDFIEAGTKQSRGGVEWHGFNNVPREHFKTTIAAISRGVQRIAEDPDGCQLVTSATQKQAVATSQAMKWHVEHNEVFQRFYPYVIPDSSQWAMDEWRVLPRVKGKPRRRESTVMSISVGGTPESFHFDWLTQDDLVTRKNSRSRARSEEVIEFFQLSQALLNEGGEEIINGTRFEDDDLYGWIGSDENETSVETFRRAVKEEDEGGKSYFIFPEEWNDQRLMDKKKNMSTSTFFCQYYNDPIPEELQKFRPDFFKYFKKPGDELSYYIGCDSSTGMAKEGRGDKCGIVVVGMDAGRNFDVVEEITELWREQQIIDCLDRLNEEYTVVMTRLETYGQAKSMLGSVEAYQEETGIYWPIEGSSGSKEQKVPRIVGLLQPLYERRKIRHQIHLRGGRLEYQLTRLGVSSVNDLADGLYQAISAALDGGYWGAGEVVQVPTSLHEKVIAGHPLDNDERVVFAPTILTRHIIEDSDAEGDYL